MTFTPINGPIRVVPVPNVPALYLAVDRLGIYLASGREMALRPMADAWNKANPASGAQEPVKVSACPECKIPKESEEQEKCLSCLNPAPVVVEQEDEEKKVVESEWF